MEKEIVNHSQEAQRVPYRINPRRNMARYIVIKLTQSKHKVKKKKKKKLKEQGKPHMHELSAETLQERREW